MVSRSEEQLLWQKYLNAREQALADWQRFARLAELLSVEFTTDTPHGGDLDALSVAFSSATSKTRDAVARYRQFLSRQP